MATLVPQPTEKIVQVQGISFEEFLVKYAGIRAEWSSGKVEVLVTNNTRHNDLVLWLGAVLLLFLARSGLGRVLLAGVPMRFKIEDELRSREPDLMVVLTANLARVTDKYVDGPADFVVEIISPESDSRDRGEKFVEFEAAGVLEYLLIDPLRATATLFQCGPDKRYHPAQPDAQGRIRSAVLPGFALDPAVLWQESLPAGAALIALAEGMGIY